MTQEDATPEKTAFDIDAAISRLREAVAKYPKAALFELAEEGYTSIFELLVASIISIRTMDEITLPAAHCLFAKARTALDLALLTPEKIDRLIFPCTFHERKGRTIWNLACQVQRNYGGDIPADPEVLTSFEGVGPKCANLTLGIACKLPLIGVDVHVHRLTNRWGYVQTTTPEKTMAALQEKLPQAYWVEINALLVPFGKHVCTRTRPHCSTCPLQSMCQQVGVKSHR